jgi:ATP-dependent Clp protease ATP-binding subunit ClpA
MIVTDDLVGSEGDLAKVVLKPGAFGRGECREESLAGRVRCAEVRQLAPGLVGGDNMTIAGGDQQPVSILRGLRERLEVFHGVKIADSALVTAVTLSHRYISDGRLTDAQGRTVDFRNTVIIMTSNIGSEWLTADAVSDGEIKPDARERVLAEMRVHFRPEFLNRLDDIVLFKPLTQAETERIVDLMTNDLRARLSDRRMTLEISAEARRFIAQQGFDPIYGARPLRRFISREVETRIGRALLAGDVLDGAAIRIGYADGELAVSYENQE